MAHQAYIEMLGGGNSLVVLPTSGAASVHPVCAEDDLPGTAACDVATAFDLACENAGDDTWVFVPAVPSPADAETVRMLILPPDIPLPGGFVAVMVYKDVASAPTNGAAARILAGLRDAELSQTARDGESSPDAFVDLEELYLDLETNEFTHGPTCAPQPIPTVVGPAVMMLCHERICGMVGVHSAIAYL